MTTSLHTSMTPIDAIRSDPALTERLMREAFEEAFCDVLDEMDAHKDEAENKDNYELLAVDAVECAVLTNNSIEAFIRLRSMDWFVDSQTLRAFENLFRMVDRDKHALLCERSRRIGYKGPIEKPSIVKVNDEQIFVFQPSELIEGCELIAVSMLDDKPQRLKDGGIDIWAMRWLDLVGDIVVCDDRDLIKGVQAAYAGQKKRFAPRNVHQTDLETQSVLVDLLEMLTAD